MKLKQEDRELFRIFFYQKQEWMKTNSLNISENLNTLKKSLLIIWQRRNKMKTIHL